MFLSPRRIYIHQRIVFTIPIPIPALPRRVLCQEPPRHRVIVPGVEVDEPRRVIILAREAPVVVRARVLRRRALGRVAVDCSARRIDDHAP